MNIDTYNNWSNWNKVKKTVVARWPEAREFAKRAVAGTAGAGASIMVGTVICKMIDGPTMSIGQIASYAVASGMISACTSSAPLEGLIHGVVMGLLAQCVFSHAVSNEQQTARQMLKTEKKAWYQKRLKLEREALDWKNKYNSVTETGVMELLECEPGLYRTRAPSDEWDKICKFDWSKSETRSVLAIIDCKKYRGLYNFNCNRHEDVKNTWFKENFLSKLF